MAGPTKHQEKEHELYHQNKLMRAGDIETEPGPTAYAYRKKSKCLHPLIIILSLVIVINKIKKMQENLETNSVLGETNIHNGKLNQLIHLSYFLIKLRQRNLKPAYHATRYLAILLIIAGDIHPNPGPKDQEPKCISCKIPVSNSNAKICETCNGWSHIQCPTLDKNSSKLPQKNYQWLCPNPTCAPNYMIVEDGNLSTKTNRYEILENHKEHNNCRPKKKKPKIMKHKNPTEKTNLFTYLPKISSKEYIGKEICKSCHTNIGTAQKAISCDICQRWTHQKCSNMKMKTYIANSKKKNFPWVCESCRIDDCNTYEAPDTNVLKQEELPEEYETVRTETRNDMLIVHMNGRSLVNKIDELEHVCQKLKPDIVCATESWFDDAVPSPVCTPTGYKIIRKDRSEEFKQTYGRNKGGGVVVYYKEHLNVERKEYLTDNTEEILWVQVKSRMSFMLGVVYRAEYTNLLNENSGESKLEENLRKATGITERVIVTGDFNVDTSRKNKESDQLKTIYKCYGLSQLIEKPTRVDTKTMKASTIDHIWTNKDIELIKKTGTIMGLSDHFGIYMTLNMEKQNHRNEVVKHRSFKKYNPEHYKEDLEVNLQNSNINRLLEVEDVNGATDELVKVMQDTANKHAPIKEFKPNKKRKPAKWATDELEEKIDLKNELLTDYFTTGIKCLKVRANKMKNEINHLKRKLKKVYFTDKVKEANKEPKKLWKILKEITGTGKNKDSTEPDMLTQEKADKCNTYFATIGTAIQRDLNVQPHPTDYTGLKGYEFQEESEESIAKIIDIIDAEVAVGDDTISARLIKDAKTTIVPYLTKIINLGHKKSIFPESMKNTIIKPIHKKNSKDDIANYRPLSILPTLSKIFERPAAIQILAYLELKKRINKNQHAYRRLHSTITCLVEVLDYIYRLFDNKRYCAIVSLDLSKAFDSISHTLLLHKLTKLGLGEGVINWTRSYLKDRKQRTKFKHFTSKEETIVSGIPQGSIIGPLLFVCFTNDLSEEFKDCKMVAYADDTQLIVEAKNLHQLKTKIENAITTAQKWYEANSMKNNITKTEILLITPGRCQHQLKIKVVDEGKETLIKTSSTIKVLGVKIDEKLNWKKQINAVKKKAMNTIRNLSRTNHLLPLNARLQLYKSLVEPHFSYADIVWGGCGITNANRLQLAQNYAARSMLGMKKSESATTALKKLNLLKLSDRRKIHETVFTHKSLLNKHPENINTAHQNQISKRNTRSATANKLTIPRHRTSKFEQSPLYRSITSWNAVPSTFPFGNIKLHKNAYQQSLLATL